MKFFRLSILLLLCFCTAYAQAQTCDPHAESLVLSNFSQSMNSRSWTVKWDTNKPVSQWHGVTVNSAGCVTKLELPDNNLSGNLSQPDLPFLEVLDLSDNKISSQIPKFTDNKKLRELDLSGNQLRGSLPELNESTALEILKLQDNKLAGKIPDYNHLTRLKHLDLSENDLSGELPAPDDLTQLEHLDISENNLSGNIEFIEHLKNLKHIDLRDNQLTGFVPALKDFPDLEYADFSDNKFSEAFPEIVNLPEIKYLNFSSNRLSGSFSWPSQAPQLEKLFVSDNNISGSLPAVDGLPNLKIFHISRNMLKDSIPVLNLPGLEELFLDHNFLTGTVPDFTTLPSLEQFSLEDNSLENIRFTPAFLDRIFFADISNNRFTFEDLVPFREFLGPTLEIHPQKPIPFELPRFRVTKGNNFSIILQTRENHFATKYDWYKNGEKINFKPRHELSLSNIIPADEGAYTVVLTNTQMPSLTIHTDTFYLEVDCPTVIEERHIYLCPGETFTFKGREFDRDTTFSDTVYTQNDRDCDSLYFFEIERYHPDTVHAEATICAGDTYYFGPDSIELTVTGDYTDTFPNIGGCDSIVYLSLTVHPFYEYTREMGLCPGDSLVYGDTVYYEDIDLIDTLTSSTGCDSIVIRQVRFSDPILTEQTYELCGGDSILIGEIYYKNDISWTDTLTARGGCDSIATTRIRVFEPFEETEEVRICAPERYTWQGREISVSGFYSDTLQTMHGCDSILHLDLLISPSYESRDTSYICRGDSILFGTSYISEPGTYFTDRQTQAGCDSISVLTIQYRDYIEQTTRFVICKGDTLDIDGNIYTEAGIYTDTILSATGEGCDTLSHIQLEITEPVLAGSDIQDSDEGDSTGRISVDLEEEFPPYHFEWSTGDSTAVLDSVSAGVYSVVVTDSLGCSAEFEFEVSVLTATRWQPEAKKWVTIRPNLIERASDRFLHLDFHQTMNGGEAALYNEVGQKVWHRSLERISSGQTVSVQLGNLTPGVYALRLTEINARAYQIEKIVVF